MEFFIPVFFVLLAQAVIFGFLCQSLCEKKGHDSGFWIGFFFGILGLLYVVGLPDRSGLKNIPTVIRRDSKPCPYCGGELKGQYELCKHCRSPLSYVDGIPCKPGLENTIKEDIERVAKEYYESQKITFSTHNYESQKPKFSTHNNVDYIRLSCYCGNLIETKCSDIGSMHQCKRCQRKVRIFGVDQYKDYLDLKSKTSKDKNDILIVIGIAVLAILVILFR